MGPQYVDPAAVIDCDSPEGYAVRLPDIIEEIERRGFAIVRMWDASEDALLAAARLLGTPQHHAKADANGIARVTPERDATQDVTFDRNVSRSAEAFGAHTDGSYLDGLCSIDGKVRRVMPPAMFLLQCIRPAASGGLNFFIDGRELFLRLAQEAPDLFDLATRPGLIDFCGGALVAMSCPLFAPRRSGRWRIRFRSDLMYAQAWARPGLQTLIERYIDTDLLRLHHSLEPREIVICDNLRMLHGRDAIQADAGEGPRLLRRLWLWDEEADEHLPLGRTIVGNDSIFDAFRDYAPLPWSSPSDDRARISLGIDASPSHSTPPAISPRSMSPVCTRQKFA